MTGGEEGVRLMPGHADGCMELALKAPRANALEPGLLDALRHALDEVERLAPATLLVTGGRNFCSGGDVARFHDAALAGEARAYAARVVPALQETLLRLLGLPSTVVLAARGAITGGGAGFLFASDLAVLGPGAFVQPYYGRMGFAPDGGWTALLPERIGAGRALAWLLSDRRAGARELVEMGLAESVDSAPEDAARALLAGSDPESRRKAKALCWDTARLERVRARLDAETAAFHEQIERPETRRRMAEFLGTEAGAGV